MGFRVHSGSGLCNQTDVTPIPNTLGGSTALTLGVLVDVGVSGDP